jgi:hypothetical protein
MEGTERFKVPTRGFLVNTEVVVLDLLFKIFENSLKSRNFVPRK